MAVSAGELDHHSGSVPGLTSGQATGTALPGTVGRTTLPAALAASNVALSRMTLVVAALILTFNVPEVQDSVAIDLDGNPEIGFAPGEIYVALKKTILGNKLLFL